MSKLKWLKILYTVVQSSIQMETKAKNSGKKLRHGRADMKELENNLKCKNMLLQIKAKIIYTVIFPVTICKCETWTVKKTDNKTNDSLDM